MSDCSTANTVVDSCHLCAFVFVDKKRKRNVTGDVAKRFVNKTQSTSMDSVWLFVIRANIEQNVLGENLVTKVLLQNIY